MKAMTAGHEPAIIVGGPAGVSFLPGNHFMEESWLATLRDRR
jgi:hypothetical protein